MKPMQNPLTSLEVEEAVIGILIVDEGAYVRVADRLRLGCFSGSAPRNVFAAIQAVAQGGTINYVSVANWLEADGTLESVGGAPYLTGLVNSHPHYLYLDQYVDKLRTLAQRRDLVQIASTIARDAHDVGMGIIDVQASAQSALLAASADVVQTTVTPAARLASDLLTRVGAFMSGEAQWNTVPTGLAPLDECLAGGLEPGVYIIAGRASIGKTALLLQIAANIAMRGERVAIFSIEMSERELGLRLASGLARVPLRTIKSGGTTPEQNASVLNALGQISEWPMHLIDQSTLRAADVLMISQRIALEHKDLKAVFVDGLWLMTPEGSYGNRVQELGSISKAVKRAQRHLDVPIVITHQLSRGPEHRADKRPLLSDLRDSGDVEQDSDVVLMLYRESYYDMMTTDNTAEMWIRKNRLGGESNEVVKMCWVQNIGRFERLAYTSEL